ncbi:g9662 [Coccomyxa viridis]|uniref:G9662 protein n=1 Tax=Coccomyxa viridis TaxID=1274662 RepID=A0ABP1G3M7_9CHLO
MMLLHSLPIFDGHNGTVYLDSAASNHKCHADGGLHEFLILGKHAVPWTAEAEAAEASRCARFSLGDIEHVVHETGISWEWLVEVSMRRIWKYQPWLRTMLLGVLQELQAAEKPIIAIHVKAHGSTPVQKHLALPPQEYINLFARTFPHVKKGTCIVAGGSEAQNEEAQALAAQTIGCKPLNRSALHMQEGDPQKVPHASWKAHCLMTRNLLFDLELLAHADYFVGTSKSGLTPIIEAMRHVLYGKDRRTFITHGGDWYERIREYFREHHVMPD